MSLKTYRQKRDFKKTSEPAGKTQSTKLIKQTTRLYLIQKHAASHLHYDLRLELDGVLKSWAVPKGPSLDPSIKRLAMHVEDHPLEYGTFQGIIPKGEYGGGTVMLWDQGKWQPVEEHPLTAYQQGHLSFIVDGKKLKGRFTLVRIKQSPKSWLLIKAKDEYAQSQSEFDVTKAKPNSVSTGQTMDAITKQFSNYPKKTVKTDQATKKKKR